MSSLRNAHKASQRLHRERSQPAHRAGLGILEKKKDYKKRALHYQAQRDTIIALKKKAQNKNPDEFYFHMINSKLIEDVHREKEKVVETTDEQIKLMQTQDLKYINFKSSTETKKIETLKSNHHLLDIDAKPKNKHTFFVDSEKDAKSFDVVQHLETHPALIDRSYNRLKVDDLKKKSINVPVDGAALAVLTARRKLEYRELAKRIEREKSIKLLAQKMEMKRHLMDKKMPPVKKIAPETPNSAPIYVWRTERKK